MDSRPEAQQDAEAAHSNTFSSEGEDITKMLT
jgi:hypothetical protein